jgi:signal transduction histidine kinase/streptogramin lyase
MSLHLDATQQHIVWYGTWGSGLHSYNDLTGKTEVYEHTGNAPLNISNIVFDIAKRDMNTYWMCTEKGLMTFDKNTHAFQFTAHEIDNPNSLWGGEYHTIYIDNQGLIWLPSTKGLEMIDPLQQAFRPIPLGQKTGLYNLQWNTKTQTLVGTSLYVNRSLWSIKPFSGEYKKFSIPQADEKMLEPIGVQTLDDGRILIGVTRKNPFIFNPSTNYFEEIKLNNLLSIEEKMLDIRSAVQDDEGNVWMANHKGGIIIWNPKDNVANIIGGNDDLAKPIGMKGPTQCVLKHGDYIYGFVHAKGIMRINAHNLECSYILFNNKLLEQASYVVCHKSGHFWFATPSSGLIECVVTDTIQILHIYNNELPDNALENIYADTNDLLWINASDGLICFNAISKTAFIYGEADGLYPYNSDFTLTQGESNNYYYLNEAGLGTFVLNDLEQPTKYYKTVLSQFFASDISIKLEAELSDVSFIELQPNQNNISFAFSALCFSGMEKLEFAYKLEGFDADWHYISNNHNGSYTNLPPGKYTLWLNSKYTGIPWETNVTAIEIIVKPHYYQTLWFKALVVLLLLSLVVVIIRTHFQNKLKQAQVELEKQKSIQNIRTRISRDIHDEIGAGLTKISLMSKMMEKVVGENNQAQDQIKKINNASRQLVQNLGEIVWTINPNNDSLSDLLAYLRSYMNDLAQTTDCKISLLLPEITPVVNSVALHPETKRNLLLIIKESLNNALKHSGASKIELNITYVNGTLSVSIIDNGRGFLMNENERKGNGLRNMRKRAEDIGSVLEVDTFANEGTTVHLNLKV